MEIRAKNGVLLGRLEFERFNNELVLVFHPKAGCYMTKYMIDEVSRIMNMWTE